MGLRRSPGSSDVFFKVVFGLDLRIAIRQDILKFDDNALDLFTIKLGANPNNETGNGIHNSFSLTLKNNLK